jgi:hypothetical protein
MCQYLCGRYNGTVYRVARAFIVYRHSSKLGNSVFKRINCCLDLRYGSVKFGRPVPAFRRNVGPVFSRVTSTLKMESGFVHGTLSQTTVTLVLVHDDMKTLINFYQSAQFEHLLLLLLTQDYRTIQDSSQVGETGFKGVCEIKLLIL